MEQDTTRAEFKTWILKKITQLEQCYESSAYSADSGCVARYGHCAETYAIDYFANCCMKKVGANSSAALPSVAYQWNWKVSKSFQSSPTSGSQGRK